MPQKNVRALFLVELMEKIRILHCLMGNMNVGGIETMLMELYRNVNRNEIQFDFLVHDKERNFYEDEICKLGGIMYRVPYISKHPIRHCICLYNLLNKHPEYKIVHIHATYAIMYMDAKIAKSLGRIVVIHSHNSNANRVHTLIHRLLKNSFSSLANYRLACSNIAAKWMFPVAHLDDVIIWKNAIHLEEFSFKDSVRKSVREKYGVKNNFIIGTVGRLSYQKNHKLLLDLFLQLLDILPDAVLWIVGDGEDRMHLEQQVKRMHLDEKVLFLGNRSNVADFLMAFDVFVLTSRWEGLPLVAVEAQAAGLPIIIPKQIEDSLLHITNNVYVVKRYRRLVSWIDVIKRASCIPINRYAQYEAVKLAGFDIYAQVRMASLFYKTIYEKI